MTTSASAAALALTSTDLTPGGKLPPRHATHEAGGLGISPQLSWTPHPDALSYAVTCYDPDAPTGSGAWHWVLADVPATVNTLPAATEDTGRSFLNDLGLPGYAGAAPPPGAPHRYEFRVHALDVATLPAPDSATNAIARYLITTHSLASAALTVTYGAPR